MKKIFKFKYLPYFLGFLSTVASVTVYAKPDKVDFLAWVLAALFVGTMIWMLEVYTTYKIDCQKREEENARLTREHEKAIAAERQCQVGIRREEELRRERVEAEALERSRHLDEIRYHESQTTEDPIRQLPVSGMWVLNQGGTGTRGTGTRCFHTRQEAQEFLYVRQRQLEVIRSRAHLGYNFADQAAHQAGRNTREEYNLLPAQSTSQYVEIGGTEMVSGTAAAVERMKITLASNPILEVKMEETDRQLILRGLAISALIDPGFEDATREAAKGLRGESMFDSFKDVLKDRLNPQYCKLELVPPITPHTAKGRAELLSDKEPE